MPLKFLKWSSAARRFSIAKQNLKTYQDFVTSLCKTSGHFQKHAVASTLCLICSMKAKVEVSKLVNVATEPKLKALRHTHPT